MRMNLSLGLGAKRRVVAAISNVWLLVTGVWSDAGGWNDASTWNDGA